MGNRLRKINTVALVVMAASLATMAYRQMRPACVQTDKGIFDTHSGHYFQQRGEKLVPIEPPHEWTEDKLRRDHPDGQTY